MCGRIDNKVEVIELVLARVLRTGRDFEALYHLEETVARKHGESSIIQGEKLDETRWTLSEGKVNKFAFAQPAASI